MSAPASNFHRHLDLWRFALLERAVRTWMRHPRAFAFVGMASMFLVAVGVMVYAFSKVLHSGAPGMPALALLAATMVLFICVIEPWLSCTGLVFRPRHAWKASLVPSHEPQDYLRLLHDRMMSVRAPCAISIITGRCPWLLAYGIEHVFDPMVRANMQALRLRVATPRATPAGTPRKRL